MNKLIEQLKAGSDQNNGIFRAMFSATFSFRYDDESGGILGIDQGGFLMTREELNDLIEGANKLFDFYGDEEIKKINDQKQYAFEHPQRSTREERANKPQPGWIYILQGQNNQYKIGLTTRTPDKRLAEISPKMPFTPKLIHSFKSDDVYFAEDALHSTFQDRRLNGEWFELTPDDAAYLVGIQDGQL